MVSPAPPSKSTLSGTTTAARPCCFKMVKMCWRKLSCLLLVVAQKSSRLMMSDSLDCSPASLTMVTLLFLPNGGLARTMSYSPCLPANASLLTTGRLVTDSPGGDTRLTGDAPREGTRRRPHQSHAIVDSSRKDG